jgi:hypothetical protein
MRSLGSSAETDRENRVHKRRGDSIGSPCERIDDYLQPTLRLTVMQAVIGPTISEAGDIGMISALERGWDAEMIIRVTRRSGGVRTRKSTAIPTEVVLAPRFLARAGEDV